MTERIRSPLGLLHSADSHVNEPWDLWSERLPVGLRERAPRVRQSEAGPVVTVEGSRPYVSDALREAPTGGHDVDARIADLEADGVWGELLMPTVGMYIHAIPDPDLRIASARVYNDWLVETFGGHADRFAMPAIIPVQDIEAAVAEVERTAALGCRGVLLPMSTADQPYSLERFAPLWSAISDHSLVACMHSATSTRGFFNERGGTSNEPFSLAEPHPELPGGSLSMAFVDVGVEAQRTATWLAAGGVLARHPEVHVILIEAGAGWLGGLMEWMDEPYESYPNAPHPMLSEKPSHYVRRQLHVTFSKERMPVLALEVTGVDCPMWGSDYPHSEGSWPHSHEHLHQVLDGVDEEARRAIGGGTLARVFGLQPARAAAGG